MAVLLEGINIPEGNPITINIYRDGTWVNAYTTEGGEAVPVPPHGRCIDANSKTFPTPHRNPSNKYMKGWNACLRSVQQQPTIIPAEEGE